FAPRIVLYRGMQLIASSQCRRFARGSPVGDGLAGISGREEELHVFPPLRCGLRSRGLVALDGLFLLEAPVLSLLGAPGLCLAVLCRSVRPGSLRRVHVLLSAPRDDQSLACTVKNPHAGAGRGESLPSVPASGVIILRIPGFSGQVPGLPILVG